MSKRTLPATGDRVAYSANWLRSTGTFAGELPQLRGTIINLEEVCKDFVLAHVQWDGYAETKTINQRNLAKVGTPAMNAD